MLTLREAVQMIPEATLVGAPETRMLGVSTDTRTIQPGDLFVAIVGENFDGHDYVQLAREKGACAVMVSGPTDDTQPVIRVADTRAGFGYLARGWRRRFTVPVIVVVGSNGKTTTKEMIASILASAFEADGRLATRGSLNNDIGLPHTLLGQFS